jgi:Flp pilus assembly protein TadB
VSKSRRWYVAFLGLMLILCIWLGLEGSVGAWITAVAFVCLIASVVEQDRRARRQRQD